jgi:hypothetical protein
MDGFKALGAFTVAIKFEVFPSTCEFCPKTFRHLLHSCCAEKSPLLGMLTVVEPLSCSVS